MITFPSLFFVRHDYFCGGSFFLYSLTGASLEGCCLRASGESSAQDSAQEGSATAASHSCTWQEFSVCFLGTFFVFGPAWLLCGAFWAPSTGSRWVASAWGLWLVLSQSSRCWKQAECGMLTFCSFSFYFLKPFLYHLQLCSARSLCW